MWLPQTLAFSVGRFTGVEPGCVEEVFVLLVSQGRFPKAS